MQIIPPHAYFDAEHLERVKDEMAVLGAPRIKAVWVESHGAWVALEGCHRIRAAAALGLVPEIDEVEWSDTMTTDDVVPGSFDDTWTVAEICDDAHRRPIISFERAA